MSDDLVANLAWLASPDAERLSDYQRINEFVRCGLDAATALTEARAEIERLRRDKSAGFAFWRSIAKRFCDARKAALDRALAAESELSTLRAELDASNINHRQMATTMADLARKHEALRARVREVVGPFAEAAADLDDADKDSTDIWEAPCAMQINVGHLRAARQLMEEVK